MTNTEGRPFISPISTRLVPYYNSIKLSNCNQQKDCSRRKTCFSAVPLLAPTPNPLSLQLSDFCNECDWYAVRSYLNQWKKQQNMNSMLPFFF